MTAEHYMHEKERLSQAMNGQDRLVGVMKDITGTLEKYNLHVTPSLAFDVVKFTLETLHLEKFNLPDRRPSERWPSFLDCHNQERL